MECCMGVVLEVEATPNERSKSTQGSARSDHGLQMAAMFILFETVSFSRQPLHVCVIPS